MKDHVSEIRRDVSQQLRKVLDDRALSTVFQPIFGFREGRILGYEALVRGPEGSLVQTPGELFAAATLDGVSAELNILCVQQILRAFSERKIEGSLFLNVSPQIIMQGGFNQQRAARFLESLAIEPERVVIELTEDYPTLDFQVVHEALMLYRSMGFRIAIDDLGEGFASLRLWSELKPEYVKADKHFVTGIAEDPVKMQFLRAIQHIAENSGSLYMKYRYQRGEVSSWDLAKGLAAYLQYKAGLLDIAAWTKNMMVQFRGQSERQLAREANRWCREMVVQTIYPEAEAIVKEHLAAGHVVAIVSGATRVSRSVRCRLASAPMNVFLGEKFRVSITSVLPSQWPRESPLHRAMVGDTCERPSSGMMRASWPVSM